MQNISSAVALRTAACLVMTFASASVGFAIEDGGRIINKPVPGAEDPFKDVRGEPLLPAPQQGKKAAPKQGQATDAGPIKIADPDAHTPYRSAGKLLFTKDDGSSSFCTAQFVDSRVLLTAAHCVVNPVTGVPFGNFLFRRAAADGAYKQKVGWECAAVYPGFYAAPGQPHLDLDYAFIRTNAPADPGVQSLVMATRVPVGSAEKISAIGYPQNFDDGKYMYRADGTWSASATPGIATMDGNPMQHGSSGGAWFANFGEGRIGPDVNVIIGLNSHAGPDDQKVNGPLITNAVLALKQRLVDGCPKQ